MYQYKHAKDRTSKTSNTATACTEQAAATTQAYTWAKTYAQGLIMSPFIDPEKTIIASDVYEAIHSPDLPLAQAFLHCPPHNNPIPAIANSCYDKAVNTAEKSTGISFENSHISELMLTAYDSLLNCQTMESSCSRDKKRLEQLAIDTVLSNPEFKEIKDMISSGDLTIDATLGSAHNIDSFEISTETAKGYDGLNANEADNLEVYDAISEHGLQEELHKRRLANALIHGNSVRKFDLYHMCRHELDEVNEDLASHYAKFISITTLVYWSYPDSLLQSQAAIQNGAMGVSEIDFGKDDKEADIITASGLIFPALIHEIVKGIMEYVSYSGMPTSNIVRKYILSKTDKTDYERYDIMLGSALWDNYLKNAGQAPKDQFLLNYQSNLKKPLSDIIKLLL